MRKEGTEGGRQGLGLRETGEGSLDGGGNVGPGMKGR